MTIVPTRGVIHEDAAGASRAGVPAAPAWTEADAAVLAEADYAADRYAAWIRLAAAAAIGLVLFGAIRLTQPTWSSQLVAVVLSELLIACGAVYLVWIRRFSAAVPWLLAALDAGFLFGVGWFNPWFERLPQGYRAALVSPSLAFLLIALAAVRPRASTILIQTAAMAISVALVVWWPLRAAGSLAPRSETFERLFSDESNLFRLAIVILTGAVLAVGAHRSRAALMTAIRTARERNALQRFVPVELDALLVSATETGHATDRMADYYGAFAEGGFGLVITEGVYTDQAWSQGYLFQPGLSDSRQRDAWKPVVDRVHAGGARFIAQLMHAGALSQGNRFRVGTRGPSSVQPVGQQMAFYRGSGAYPVPDEMTQAEIDEAVTGFASAAVRAREAGFEGVEIHGANGYLLDQFVTEGVNLRTDGYGGNAPDRLRITLEVAQAVRAAVEPDFTVGVRSSQGKVNDFTHKWRGPEEAAEIYTLLGRAPVDYLHTTEYQAWKPAFGDGPSLARLAKRHGGLPVFANGSLHDPARASEMLSGGSVDLVTLGRGALTHADWPLRVTEGANLEEFDRRILSPLADLANADRLHAQGTEQHA